MSRITGAERGMRSGRLSRRVTLMGGAIMLTGALLLPGNALRAAETGSNSQIAEIRVQSVSFKNNDISLAGNVYYPKGFDESRKYAAVVVIHPGGGVKEQAAGLYAQKLAAEGFVTLAFDASHQGASGGMPRFVDDPMKRVVDIYSAVDYLTSLPYVDAERIGALGVCAGSGITVKASMTERRIKAVATVSAVDVGAATRKGWDGKGSEAELLATLDAVAKQRTAEAGGAAPVYVNYVPKLGDTTAPRDLQQAADYYLTPRGQHPNSTNQMLMTSISTLASFTGFAGAETLLTQPLLIVAGSNAGSLWHSQELNAKAASKAKELIIIDGATHMDLYDGQGADVAAKKIAPFFQHNL